MAGGVVQWVILVNWGGDWAGVASGRLGASDGCIRRGGGLVIVLGWNGRWVGRGVSPNMVGVR